MGAAFTRKYNAGTTIGGIALRTAGTADIRANPTLASGDVKMSKDGGAFANLGTLPSAVPASGKNIEVILSATELSCARAVIHCIDQTSPKEWDDFEIVVETFGNASAQFPPDYSDTVRLGQTALPNAAAGANTGLPVVGTQVPNATAGASNGLLIAGTNAATSFNNTGQTTGLPLLMTQTVAGLGNGLVVGDALNFILGLAANTEAVLAFDSSGNNLATAANLALVKADTAATLLKVATNGVYVDWSHIVNPTSTVVLSGTTIANLTNGVSVAPLVATANPTFYASENLPDIAQASAPAISWTIVDSSDAAVSLSGKTVRFVAARSNDATAAAVFNHSTGGNGVTISGTSNNIVTVQLTTTDTATAQQLFYWIWDMTSDIALVNGTMPVGMAKKTTT
jgi:hypothetical protein